MLMNSYRYYLLRMNDEEGQGLVEYALILFLVAIVVIIALASVGDEVVILLNNIVGRISNALSA